MDKRIKLAVLLVAVIFLVAEVKCGKLTDSSEDTIRHGKLTIRSDEQPHSSPDLPSSQWKSLKRSKYLTYLFRKYGSGGLITFEGLEHMMHNLGLGGLEFNPNHRVEEHHPDGYRVYEESLKEDGEGSELRETETPDLVHFERTTTTERSTSKHFVEIEIDHGDEDEGSEEIVLVKESQHRKDARSSTAAFTAATAVDNEIIVRVKTEGANEPETFISMHDPKHRHPSYKDHQSPLTGTMSCLAPSAMIKLLLQHKPAYLYKVDQHQQTEQQHHQQRQQRHVNNHRYDEDDLEDLDVNALSITPTDFVDILCPALLTQIERAECVVKRTGGGGDSSRSGEHIKSEKKLFQFAWLYATISILIISMCGLVGVAIVPLMRSSSYSTILMFLVAVAIGTLAGDALMHLLPHALTPHLDHGDDTLPSDHKNDEAVYLCAFAFLAAVFMYVLETMLPLLLSGHGHHHHHHHPEHSHGRDRRSSSIIQEEMTLEPGKICKSVDGEVEQELNLTGLQSEEMMKGGDNAPLSPIAFMVVIGDGLHNITDGLAIGAAFAFDPITGMATALAVLCHELPHELGDFALLLKTGVSIRRALILNVISSVLSLIGMAFGLFIAGIHTSMVRWIYAATAGTFLYIAMADLIPEMSREPEGKTVKAVLVQVSGILIGGLIMLTIALNEDRLRILFE